MKNVLQITILILFIHIENSNAQTTPKFTIPDSLAHLDYNDLREKSYKQLERNSKLAKQYAKIYLRKARVEGNQLEMAMGYALIGYAHFSKHEYEKRIMYLDSAIESSKTLKNKKFPAFFFINKGAVYENSGDFKKALDNYLVSIEWSKKNEHKDLEYVAIHNIGILKRKLGKYEEAKAIFKKCLLYDISKEKMTSRDSLSYLATLSELVQTYHRNNEIDSAVITNKKGFNPSKGKNVLYLFKLNDALLQYYDGKYKEVIKDTDTLLPILLKTENKYLFQKSYLINTYLYRGKSYKALNKLDSSISSFKRIDSLLQVDTYTIPEIRTVYTNLINYYKSQGDKNQQLFYVNRLLRADSILDSNYKYVSDRLVKDYDTPELLLQKEALIEDLEDKHTTSSIGILILSVVLGIGCVFLFLSYKKQKRYQQRFEELMATRTKPVQEIKQEVEEVKTKTTPASIGISEEIVNAILEQLDNFEQKQGYIKMNLTTSGLASKFGTNSKYLSKVINTYKQKSFIQYINDLRIEFIVDKLKTEAKYRMYTIKALATESGFNTTEAFSKSFYKKTGIYPSYFIKQFEKQQEYVNR
ncbi:helix-turn-helix domain-containing protein [Aquimarina celericrescens]|uniref:Helix-turn-helix domain-containing protein n=1 Tax=Aquimarina celericrescens TaxID=1964542 RepID=A0ABW5AYY8_9FLAO|nr:AraC family transcriptional regulator [Aquimarina celericrescens]